MCVCVFQCTSVCVLLYVGSMLAHAHSSVCLYREGVCVRSKQLPVQRGEERVHREGVALAEPLQLLHMQTTQHS